MSLSLKEIGHKIVQSLAKYAVQKFTGQLIFYLDFKDGGIGNCILEVKQRDREFTK